MNSQTSIPRTARRSNPTLQFLLRTTQLALVATGCLRAQATLVVPSPAYPNIHAAVAVAVAGDTIQLAAGVHSLTQTIDFTGRAFTIRGAGRNATYLDGTNLPTTGAAIRFATSETSRSVLRDLTVRRCPDGAVFARDSGPLLFNCRFEYNATQVQPGAGIRAEETFANSLSARIENCEFVRNLSSGIWVEGPLSTTSHGTALQILDCWFEENQATNGGGIGVRFRIAPTIKRCTFFENTATTNGGGIYLREVPGGTIEECTMQGNVAEFGGGLYYFLLGAMTVRHCTLANNSAIAASPIGGRGGGIFGFQNPDVAPSFLNCLLYANEGDLGGAAFFNETSPNLQFVTATQNLARVAAPGIRLEDQAGSGASDGFAIRASILYDNKSFGIPPANPWQSQLDAVGVAPLVLYCLVQGSGGTVPAWNALGLIDADPKFTTGPTHKFAPLPNCYLAQTPLQPQTSPCVDAFRRQASGQVIAQRTTRIDTAADAGFADLGFHYPRP